jgi:phage gp45-like
VGGVDSEEIENVELFAHHGMSSVPDDDSECVAIQFGHRTVVVAGVDRRIAPALEKGDVAVHTDLNQYVILKAAGGIEIRTSGNVTVFANQIRLGEGDVTQGGVPLVPGINGVVTPQCACAYAGMHVQGSASVLARNG